MSHSGSLFEVCDSDRREFAECKQRTDWYAALGRIEAREKLNEVFVDDCIDSWRELLDGRPCILARFFFGEFSSVEGGPRSGDPDMFFAGSDLVRAAASELLLPPDVLLRQRLHLDLDSVPQNLMNSIPPIRGFLVGASLRDRAIVGLWS